MSATPQDLLGSLNDAYTLVNKVFLDVRKMDMGSIDKDARRSMIRECTKIALYTRAIYEELTESLSEESP